MGLRRRGRSSDDEFDGLYDDFQDGHDANGYNDDDENSIRIGDHHFAVDNRRRPWTTFLGCLLPIGLIAAIGGGGYWGYQRIVDHFAQNTCKVRDASFDYQWSTEQSANAATIGVVGTHLLGLPTQATQIAETTAIQESKLRNLTSGDLDSLGLFQQRPSQGWGSSQEILDPIYASKRFYQALQKIDGWQSMNVNDAAQKVQKSGYPDAYAQHETQGRVLATAFDGSVPEAVGCRFSASDAKGDPAAFVDKLKSQAGVNATASATYVTYRATSTKDAWAIGSWSVTHAQAEGVTSVVVGDRAWNRQSGKAGWTWTGASHPTGSATVVRIEF
ncbi:hypothetical protein [Calidifontibacter terrae]